MEELSECHADGSVQTYLRNTVLLCLITVFGVVLSSAIVAYGFARCQFVGKSIFFVAMISTMAVPPQVTMVPIFALFKALGWYGTYLPLTVPSFFGAPFYIFLLTQFFRKLPDDMSEAARLDGSNEWGIFTKVICRSLDLRLPPARSFNSWGLGMIFWGRFCISTTHLPTPSLTACSNSCLRTEGSGPFDGGSDRVHLADDCSLLLCSEDVYSGNCDDGRQELRALRSFQDSRAS